MKRLSSFAALALALLFAAPAFAELKPGDAAPNFSLVGTDGKTYQLSDFKGKSAVVVAWFPKAKTKGCTIECKNIKEEGPKLKGYNVAYFTASVDTPAYNKEFATELGLDYPILSDPTKETAKAYDLLKPDGGVTNRYTVYVGKDGKILEIDKSVSPPTSVTDIIAKLNKHGVEKK